MILTVFRASRTTRIATCATEIALRDENCEVHNKNRVACDAIRLLLDGAFSSAFRISSSILTWLEIESAGWVVEHWGCVLVSSSLKRCIRPLWNSLLYNYLALYSGRSRGGARGAQGLPLSFRPKWGPNGRKKFFLRPGPSLSQGLDDCPPTFIWRSGSATA